jgi:hypothetical protein
MKRDWKGPKTAEQDRKLLGPLLCHCRHACGQPCARLMTEVFIFLKEGTSSSPTSVFSRFFCQSEVLATPILLQLIFWQHNFFLKRTSKNMICKKLFIQSRKKKNLTTNTISLRQCTQCHNCVRNVMPQWGIEPPPSNITG